jgi:hypothetical protein
LTIAIHHKSGNRMSGFEPPTRDFMRWVLTIAIHHKSGNRMSGFEPPTRDFMRGS